MLPAAEEHKRILIVDPAVADQIAGDERNRHVFCTASNSSRDAISNALAIGKPRVHIATLGQDCAIGRFCGVRLAPVVLGYNDNLAPVDLHRPVGRVFEPSLRPVPVCLA
jgi:hypothetical protein